MPRYTRLVLAALLLAACRGEAPEPPAPPPVATTSPLTVSGPDSLLGLLRLDGATADGSGLLPGPMHLRAAPDDEAELLVTITRWQDVVAEEVGYEEPAVAVWRISAPWYLVATSDSVFGWFRAPADAVLVPLAELLGSSLTYLTPDWDGNVYQSPGGSSARTTVPVQRDDGEASVEVLDTATVDGSLWLKLAVHEESPCFGTIPPRVIAEGWVPAWSSGKLNVWYYSRGC